MRDYKLICPNCGGEVDPSEDKCPYCGHINLEGAEKKFFEELEDKREELEELSESPEAGGAYSNEIKSSLASIAKKAIIFVAIIVVILLIVAGVNKVIDGLGSKDSNYAKELSWQNEHFTELDELYQEGKYDKLADTINDYEANHELWDWEHYDFIKMYENYTFLRDDLDELERSGSDKDLASLILYNAFTLIYRTYESTVSDESDLAVLDELSQEAEEIAHDRLGFTDKQLKSLKKQVLIDGYIDFKQTEKIAKKYYKQFK